MTIPPEKSFHSKYPPSCQDPNRNCALSGVNPLMHIPLACAFGGEAEQSSSTWEKPAVENKRRRVTVRFIDYSFLTVMQVTAKIQNNMDSSIIRHYIPYSGSRLTSFTLGLHRVNECALGSCGERSEPWDHQNWKQINGCKSAVTNWQSTKTAATTMRPISQSGSMAKLMRYQRFQRSGSQWMKKQFCHSDIFFLFSGMLIDLSAFVTTSSMIDFRKRGRLFFIRTGLLRWCNRLSLITNATVSVLSSIQSTCILTL